jgi:putative transposase
MVPDQVHGVGRGVEVLAGHAVLNAIPQGLHQRLDFVPHTFQLVQMAENVKMHRLFHCVYALTYHLVLVTKYRRHCITRPMLDMLQDIVAQRCKDWGGELIEFNGEADHVHALMSLPPNLDLSRFLNNLKTTSSRLLRSEFARQLNRVYRKPVFWSRSYCIISCGGAPLSVIKQYVEQQDAPR